MAPASSQRARRPYARMTGAFLLGLTLAGTTLAVAQTPPPAGPVLPGSQRITARFTDIDITQLADAVSAATGRNFIVDPRVRGPVSLISNAPMTASEFYQAFLSVLQVHSFAAVPAGNVIKIVPDANVRTMPASDLQDHVSSTSDEMVTQVITVKNTNAAQIVQVLRPLVAQYGLLQSVPGGNTLIISDRASNVSRLMRIIARIDQAGDSNIEVIPLQNSTAAEVVRTISALTAGQAAAEAGGVAPKVVADERSNSVLISGERSQRLRITALIAHLDTPTENGGDTQVHYLHYADAEKLAPKLKEQLTGIAASTGGTGAAGAAGGAASSPDRNATIWPDPKTNSLVITAPPKTMRSLLNIIDKLDIRRAQVLVEAIIVDVSTTNSADLGVNWAAFSKDGSSNVPAGGFITPVGGTSIVDLAQAIKNPSTATSVPTGATFAIGRLAATGVSFAAMIRALRSDTNTNVVATPSTTTMDNQEAELKVAQEVPFITGSYANSTSTSSGVVNPFTTVQRQEVGTILKITPQINGGDAMLLKIELESSALSGKSGDAGSLITNKRSVKTTVLIEDDGVVVIGGLIQDSKTGGEDRVPYLGRIPIIGEAFKSRNAQRSKTNLMVFIHTKILTDGVQTTLATDAKYNFIREEQRRQEPKGEVLPLLPFDKSPLLPPPPVPVPRKEEPVAAPAPSAPTGAGEKNP